MKNLVDQLTNINQNMLALAEQASWQKLSDMMAERQSILESFFKDNESPLSTEQANQLSILISKADNQIQKILSHERKSVIDSSLSLKNAQTALKAYKTNQNSLTNI